LHLRFNLSPDGVDPAIGPSRSVGPHGIVTEEADEFVYIGPLEGSQELSYDLLCRIAHAEVLLKLCASQPRAEYTAESRPFEITVAPRNDLVAVWLAYACDPWVMSYAVSIFLRPCRPESARKWPPTD